MRHPIVAAAAIVLSAAASAQSPSSGWQAGAVVDLSLSSDELALGNRDQGLALGHSDVNVRGPVGPHFQAQATGIGLSAEQQGRLFSAFAQADASTTRRYGGTGLGLAICKHIIEAHGESMHVRSKTDVGTTIGFTLSAIREEEGSRTSNTHQPIP